MSNPTYIATMSSAVGLLLSGYSLYIEYRISSDPKYTTICEVYSAFDCRKPLSSSWSHPLSHFGAVDPSSKLDASLSSIAITFYLVMLTYSLFGPYFGKYYLTLASTGAAVSIYLAYVAKVILNVTCPICIAIYTVNFLLLGSVAVSEFNKTDRKPHSL